MKVPPLWKKILLTVLTLCAGLGALEYFCRKVERITPFYDPMTLAGGPSQMAFDDGRFRSLGGRAIYSGLDPKKIRVLILGDSFAYSYGIPLPHSFPVFLQRKLNGGPLRGAYETINAGRCGIGMKTHFDLYAEIAAKIPHDHVVLICGRNDVLDTYAEVHNSSPVEQSGSWPRKVAERSAAALTLLRLSDARYQRNRDAKIDFEKAKEVYAEYFNRLADAVRARGALLHVLVVDLDLDSRAVFRDLSRARGLDYYEQTFSMTYHDSYRLLDGHFNRAGNARLADEAAAHFAFARVKRPPADSPRPIRSSGARPL